MKALFVSSFLYFSFWNLNCYAQCATSGSNLIPNPDFELSGTCPTGICAGNQASELYQDASVVTSWFGTEPKASCTVGSTADFVLKVGGTPNAGSCHSTMGSSSGNGLCVSGNYCLGFFVLTSIGASGREYIQCHLNATLTAGQTYCFSMVAKSKSGSVGNTTCNTDGLGAYFHNLGIINIDAQNGGNQFLGPGSIVNAVPQIQAASIIPNSSCSTVQGTFVANGTEQYLTIGNFRTDAGTSISGSGSSYMFVDDLKLYPINPLPVQLTSFTANCSGTSVRLNWTTESEKNAWYYQLERTCNGFSYENAGTINAAGNSETPTNYTFTDTPHCDGDVYYRLIQVDQNGTSVSYPLIQANCVPHYDIEVGYDPANQQLQLTGTDDVIAVSMYDMTGRLVFKKELDEFNQTIQVSVGFLAQGPYALAIIRKNQEVVTKKIILSR